MALLFRQATEEDTKKLLDLLHTAYHSDIERGINFDASNSSESLIRNYIVNNVTYLAFEENQLVSTISIRFPWGPNPGPFGLPHLGWFATNPEYKRQGYAKKTLHWLETEILDRALHLPAVSLGTAQNHPWLVDMYQHLGFELKGTARVKKDHITTFLLKIINQERFEEWEKHHHPALDIRSLQTHATEKQ